MALSGDGMGAERSPCARGSTNTASSSMKPTSRLTACTSGSASSGREDAAMSFGVRAARRSSRTTLTASVTFLSACPVLQVLIPPPVFGPSGSLYPVSYTHLRAHETRHDLVCRLLLEKKKKRTNKQVVSILY